MKRRVSKDVPYARDGRNGRPAGEIAHRWMSKAKRQTHKRERREGRAQALQDEL